MISLEMLESKLKEYTLKFVVDAKAEHYTRKIPVASVTSLYVDLYKIISPLIRQLDITADYTPSLHNYLIFLFYTKLDMLGINTEEPMTGVVLALDQLHGERGTEIFMASATTTTEYSNAIPLLYLRYPSKIPAYDFFSHPFEMFAMTLYELSDKPIFFKKKHMRDFSQRIAYINAYLLEWMDQSNVFTKETLSTR